MKNLIILLCLITTTYPLLAQSGITLDGNTQDVIIQGFGADLFFRNNSGTDIAQLEPGLSDFFIKNLQDGDLIFETDSKEVLRLNDLGNATILGSVMAGNGLGAFTIKDGANFTSFGKLFIQNLVDDQSIEFHTSTGGNQLTRMIINGNGRIAMNIGNFSHTVNIGHAEGSSASNGLKLLNQGSNGNFWGFYTNNGNGRLVFSNKDGQVIELDENGDLVGPSDRRLKTDIEYLADGYLAKINQLKPATYHYKRLKTPSNKSMGLIAQEVQKIFPDVVRVTNSDETQKETYLGIAYNNFIPILIKAMQEQQAIIENDQETIDKLQSTIQRLAADNQALHQRLAAIEAVLNQHSIGIIPPNPTESTPTPAAMTNAQLQQNFPNPFHQQTDIQYFLPENITSAQVIISNPNGQVLKSYALEGGQGIGKITLHGNALAAGTYIYSLQIDGKIIDTKQMVLTR